MKTIFYSGRLPIAACSLLLMLTTTASAEVGPNWIEQWGIRWTFDKNLSLDGAGDTYQYGQFVNGDYWVIGPVNIISIDPPSRVTEQGDKDDDGKDFLYPVASTESQWSIDNDGVYTYATIPVDDTSGLQQYQGKYIYITGTGQEVYDRKLWYVLSITEGVSFTIRLAKDYGRGDWPAVSGGQFGGVEINGSMINPPATGDLAKRTGFTSGDTLKNGNVVNLFLKELNVAWGVNEQNPLTVQANSSLISTTSRVDSGSGLGNRSGVQNAAILTVLSSDAFSGLPEGVKPEDCFRPHYHGDTKTILHWQQQLDMSFLQSLEPVEEPYAHRIPPLEDVIDYFKRPWVMNALGWTSRYIHPASNMPDYYLQVRTNHGAMRLNLNHTNEQKKPLLLVYVQLGIDLFGPFAEGSLGNPPNGGIFPGRLLPILVAGKSLDYSPMLNICQKSGDYLYSEKEGSGNYGPGDPPPDYVYIQELCQTFYVSQLEIDITNLNHPTIDWTPSGISRSNSVWIENGGQYDYGDPYQESDIGLPDYGIRHSTQPGWTCKAWHVYKSYRGLNSPHYVNTAFLLLAMGFKETVNHNAFFDYADRWALAEGASNMWNKYRNLFGPIWPDTATQPAAYTLSVAVEGGTVDRSLDKATYTHGQTVTLTVTPHLGYRFVGWEGDATGTEPSITITMDNDKTIRAVFEPIEYAPVAQQLAHLPLTEAINGQVSDLSVNMHTATAAGNVTFESGMGARFDGSDGYLRVADADSLGMQEPMTISVWICPMGPTPYAKLIVKPVAAYASPWEMYAIDLGSSGDTPRFVVTDGIAGGRIVIAANRNVKLQTGQWHHLVAVYDGQSIALYLDSSLVAQESVPFQIGTNHEPLCIGGRMGLNTFNGYICDVEIYQGAFTPEQVSGTFSHDRNGGLAGHWLFERPYMAEVANETGGQPAQLIGEPEWGEGWAAEYFVRLNSGKQAVQIPLSGCSAEAGTIALWVQPEAASSVANPSALQVLFGHAVSSDANRITLYTVESTDGDGNTIHKLAIGLGDNAALSDNIAQLIPGRLYHIALTWDGTTYAVFVDGLQQDTGTFSGLTHLEAFADVGNLGTDSGRAYASGFCGIVDEIQLYRRALNAEEITRLFLTHTAKENRLIEFAVYGTDDAGSPIYYTAKNLPAGATFDAQKQTFFWRPALYQSAGNYEIVFAADGYPDQKITVSVQDTELAGWYIKFLESRGLH